MTATTDATARAFDLLGALPEGTTLLEASAGTGKTFTIAGLVTRYVAEGAARLDEMLVVTFGRAATQELRDRVRDRLVSARDGLRDPAAARGADDELLRHLATAPPDEIEARQRRLAEALASFDAATVATTHQFCQQVLAGLGTAGDVDAAAVLIDNLDDLTVEVVQDLYVRMWARPGAEAPPMSFDQAVALAHTVVRDGQAILVPEDAAADSPADVRHRFATAVRTEVERRKRARYLLGYDDLLTRLRATLGDHRTGGAAAQRLRARYRVVLVDEFQDTDPVQWDILRLAFHGHTTLVLIGDPKQAIYAFRGADVYAYLAAKVVAGTQATLARNWRSDPDLLRGLDALFRGATLGDPLIRVQPVEAAHQDRSLDHPGAPVQLRTVSDPGATAVGRARDLVVEDLVAEVVELLERGPLLTPRDGSAARPLVPGDIAVVVRSSTQLEQVHAALLAAGVPSVQRTTSSVFRTPAGKDWVVLLEALEQPHRSSRIRRLAVTAFVGWDAADLETGDLDGLSTRVRRWAAAAADGGVAALLEAVARDQRLPPRLLGQVDGERSLTDLRHIGEALHAAATAGQLGLTATLEWLRHRVEESDGDSALERSRRLDSDAAAVQVVTTHASKGLEFPVVLVPFGWDRHLFTVDLPLFHDTERRRVRNVGGTRSPGFAQDVARHQSEEAGEDLRLLYVAVTRAQARCVVWWAASAKNTRCAPLHRLLLADDPAVEVPEGVDVPAGERGLASLRARAVPGCLEVVAAEPGRARRRGGTAADPGELAAARLDRDIDAAWRRTSYTALTHAAHDANPRVGSEADVEEKDDEPATPPPADDGDTALQAIVSPMSALPGGAGFGTFVHAVLEELDTGAPDLEAELADRVQAVRPRHLPDGPPPEEITVALLPSLRTPLGPPAAGRSLADLAPADRLSELEFELPLRGGDAANGRSHLRDLAGVLRRHLPAADPLRAYAERLTDPAVADAPLRGYLTGSIDAVLRVDGRYVVVDYKTNRLGEPGATLTAWDYRAEATTLAMIDAHYPLQALLYEVALHRFLRWRLPGYDPARHLGGVLYLFLRGMCGPGVTAADGSIPGVVAWQPPAGLVVALSDLLARGAEPGERA